MILHPHMRLELARAHADQLRRQATRATGGQPGYRHYPSSGTPAEESIVIRPSRPQDEYALVRLAQLDCARVPAAPVLLAEVGGQLRAALSLKDGAAIADPFHRTASLVALLTARAEHLHLAPAGGRGLFARVRRLAARKPAIALPRR